VSSVSGHYTGGSGKAYHEGVVEPWSERATTLALPLFRSHVGPEDVVVDFGCGSGRLLTALPARRRIGIEVNPVSAAEARARGVEVVAASADVPESVADVVVSHHALEHALDPFGELVGLRRVLKPGGRLLLVVPLDDWRRERDPWPDDPNHHLFAWTPLALCNLLGEAGFDVLECAIVSSAPLPRRLDAVLPALGRAWVPSGAARLYAITRKRRQIRVCACVP
jgi:SAM-dependent methyltransferase